MVHLFSECVIREHIIGNRVVMPPMVCFGWAGNDGMVTEKHVRHYEARARGGVGLIIVEATCISKEGRLDASQLGLWEDSHIEGFARLAEACHKHGAKVLVQIHHAGYKASPDVTREAVAPSDCSDGGRKARALTLDEIMELQDAFAAAAVRAQKAGLDGIELHGAHGYLINQFMSPVTNGRVDAYGGSFAGRIRFAAETVAKIRARVGSRFIIGYRMGGNEPTLENGIAIAQELERQGVDLLHVSAGISAGEKLQVPQAFAYNWIVYCSTQVKKQVTIPVIVVNGIRKAEQAEFLIDRRFTDFVAVGKGLLVDAEWANKAKDSSSIVTCLECPSCSWFTSGSLCPRVRQAGGSI